MAGGPLYPSSMSYAGSEDIYPNVHVGDGTNAHRTDGAGVEASLGANADLMLEFDMPPTLPTGQAKIRCIGLADATTGNARLNPQCASIAIGEDPSAATLTAEGVQTVSWSTNDDDEYQELKVDLDAVAPVASEIYVIHLRFETASWTLAAESTWKISIIWE